jgi:molecular chaperone IbpA
MRNFDLTPLWRSTIGFERLFDLIDNSDLLNNQDSHPPYDIARIGEDAFRISLAVAGFAPDHLTITAHNNLLTVTGSKPEPTDMEYVYQGIPAQPFERRFSLADYVEVKSASCENGLLQIDLVRRIPEAMKPRRIQIGAATGRNGGEKQIKAV